MKVKFPAVLIIAFSSLAFGSSCHNAPWNPAASGDIVKNGAEKGERENSLPPLSEAEKRILDKLGGELLPDQNIRIGNITIHRREMEISFPGSVNMTAGDMEVLIALPHGRVHESLLVSQTDPLKLQLALLLAGAENGSRDGGEKIQQGTLLNIDIQPKDGKRMPVEDCLEDKNTSARLDRFGWVFVGSSFTHDMRCLAKEEGNIVNIWSFGNTILDNPASSGNNGHGVSVITEKCPKYKTPVTIFISFKNPVK